MFGLEADTTPQEDRKKKIQEFVILNEACDRKEKELLDELGVTPEQLTTYVQNRNNFSEKSWEELQKQRKQLDDTLKSNIQHILNPSKSKQVYAEQKNVRSQWLYVK